MLRYHSDKGLPPWIFEELKAMQEMSYRYEDEPSPEDFVENMAENMAPAYDLPADRLLDALSLLYEFDPVAVADLLDHYFTPANSRIDLTSTKFGRAADFEDAKTSTTIEVVDAPLTNGLFDPTGIMPLQEPLFGAQYWCQNISNELQQKWTAVSQAQLPPLESNLSLPKQNEFVPTEFELKPLPKTDIDQPLATEEMIDGGDKDDLDESVGFPPIPARLHPSQLPSLLCDTNILKLWHLQDRVFKRPTAELRLLVYCADAGKSPLHSACSDLLVRLISESLNEVVYMASMCDLSTSISSVDSGFSIRVNGFDHKLMTLFGIMLDTLLSFRGEDSSTLPRGIEKERFDLCLESNRRRYVNAGMQASSLASDVRIKCLTPKMWSPNEKVCRMTDVRIVFTCSIANSNACVLEAQGNFQLGHSNISENSL
mmetsp:Transcript_46130/g.111780  ORF Transcript_46130/g.111780 Transcript_46130/m.111780 type:complete len:428 (-) Transcript_46130:815-2098(-)